MATVEQVKNILGKVDGTLGDPIVYDNDGEICGSVICAFCMGAVNLRLSGEVGKVHCNDCQDKGCAQAEVIIALNDGSLGLRVRRG